MTGGDILPKTAFFQVRLVPLIPKIKRKNQAKAFGLFITTTFIVCTLHQHFLIRIIPRMIKNAATIKSINRQDIQHKNIMPRTSRATAAIHLPLPLCRLIFAASFGNFSLYFILFPKSKSVTKIKEGFCFLKKPKAENALFEYIGASRYRHYSSFIINHTFKRVFLQAKGG